MIIVANINSSEVNCQKEVKLNNKRIIKKKTLY